MRQLSFLLFFLCTHLFAFEQVVIWGHKLHSHTHSYIHNAFFRAFQEMNYPVHWLDDNDDVSLFDFTHSLFITEGQVDNNIPLREDCDYILHNCTSPKYKPLYATGHAICLQVYTDDVLARPTCKKIDHAIYYDISQKCIYMPWATDLLPREIDEVKWRLPTVQKKNMVYWVGTIGEGYFGNKSEIDPFIKAAVKHRIGFKSFSHLSMEENRNIIASAYMAPAIVGEWQKQKGYIPCRIFKNISYGQMGMTNSLRVAELFEGRVVYNPDTYQLFLSAKDKLESMSIDDLYNLMDFVKKKHTYINRIASLLEFFDLVKNEIAIQYTQV